jgi:DNA-binding CsgD family transcriptional regulator
MGISVHTVYIFVRGLLMKFNVKSRAKLMTLFCGDVAGMV